MMTLPILTLTEGCWNRVSYPSSDSVGKMEMSEKILTATVIVETFVVLTASVLGILGILGIISLPPILAYPIISLSGSLIAMWVIGGLSSKGKVFNDALGLVRKALEQSDTSLKLTNDV